MRNAEVAYSLFLALKGHDIIFGYALGRNQAFLDY